MREPRATPPRPAAAPALPPGALLRPLREEDAPAIAALAERLGQRASEAWWRRRLARLLREDSPCQGVEVDGRLVAYMLGQIRGGAFGLAEETAFVEFLGVDPAYQGRGLARTLAEVLFDRLTEQGVQRVLTLVSARDDRVRPFFRSLGLRQSHLVCLERRL
jgi:ribosomal protein S18 acetylase RimI-like enzyme